MPRRIQIEDIIVGVETAIRRFPKEEADEIRNETRNILSKAKPPPSNLTKEEREALQRLSKDNNLVILPADKGNATVIMESQDYHNKVVNMLQDGTYTKLQANPLQKVKRRVAEIIKNATSMDDDTKKKLQRVPQRTPTFYGLPKIHKPEVPLRPIVSAINSPTHPLARHLARCLRPLSENIKSRVTDSRHFIEILKNIKLNSNDLMVSFDVTSLFTKVPVEEAINIIEDKLKAANLPSEWANLTKFCLETTFFQYQDNYYGQREGAAMGSPLSPIIADIFMEALETEVLNNITPAPTHWYRYVDDTFVVWPHGKDKLPGFLHQINSQHPNIRFTMEIEENNQLPFLDVLVKKRDDGSLAHCVYRKPTHTNRYLNAASHHHPATKRCVLNTLVKRAERICDADSLQEEMTFLRRTFQENGYDKKTIRNMIKKRRELPPTNSRSTLLDTTGTPAFLPYIEKVTDRIGKILKKRGIRTVFNASNKLHSRLVNVKDRPARLATAGIYSIPCSCGLLYIGQTGRTVEERRREHIRYCKLHQVDKSAIAQHSAETGHAVDFDKIDVLGREDRRLPRLIKEAIQIAKHPHNINRDDGYQLSSAWRSLLDVHHRATHPDTAATEDRGDIFIPLPPP